MRSLAAVFLIPALFLAACGDDDDGGGDGDLLSMAIEALEGADSYYVESLTVDADGSELTDRLWVDGDRYRVVSSGTSNEPDVVVGTGEFVVDGEDAFYRECADVDRDCDDWERLDSDIPVGFLAVSPETLTSLLSVLAEQARETTNAGTETIDGRELERIEARYNPARANAAFFDALPDLFSEPGEFCYTVGDAQATPTEVCEEFTPEPTTPVPEEIFEEWEDRLMPLTVWVDPESGLPYRIETESPADPFSDDSADHETGTSTLVFSDFGEVVVEAPEVE